MANTNTPLGQQAIERRFIPMVERAVLVSDRDPEALYSVEEQILHLGTDEDRKAAQRILLRAQDAHRMDLRGARTGFIWTAGMRLDVQFLDDRAQRQAGLPVTLTQGEARRLWELLDLSVRDQSKDAYFLDRPRLPGVPEWPGVVLNAAARCNAETRAWIGFHSVANMGEEQVGMFSGEGGALPGPLMVCAAIPDDSMHVRDLQDAAKAVPDTAYAQGLRERLEGALQQAMAEMPQIKLGFGTGWTRMSTLVEEGDVQGAAAQLVLSLGQHLQCSAREAAERYRESFPGGIELVCGSLRTELPEPGQAVYLPLYGAAGGRTVTTGFGSALPGTVLADVAHAAAQALAQLGLEVTAKALPPMGPVQRLGKDTMRLPCADGVYRDLNVAYFGRYARGFKRFDWEAGWNFDGPAFESDEAYRKLGQMPHPLAMQAAGVETALAAHYEPALLEALHTQLAIPGRSSAHAMERMMAEDDDLRELEDMQFHQDMKSDTIWYAPRDGIRPPEGMYCAAHWKRAGGVLMVARRSLMDRLEETSIERGFPLRSLKLPYPDIYFHFEQPLKHHRADGITFILTGFYASEEDANDGTGSRRMRFTYTYLYAGEVMRIGGLYVNLQIEENDGRDLSEVVAEQNARVHAVGDKIPHDEVSSMEFTNDTLVTAAKVVLYTTLKNARMTEVKDRSKLVDEVRNLKGNKRDKMRARIAQAYDYIAIGPEESNDADGAAELRAAHQLEARGITPHWRRGFYRTQRFGAGRAQAYDVWIPPVLVNGHLVDGAPPIRKDYFLD